MASLWRDRTGVLSTQVIQELLVNLRRKASNPLPAGETRRLVQDYLCWPVVVNDGAAILEALELEDRYRLSFRDALIVQAAIACGAATLYTEDLNHGQTYGGVRAVDPFR